MKGSPVALASHRESKHPLYRDFPCSNGHVHGQCRCLFCLVSPSGVSWCLYYHNCLYHLSSFPWIKSESCNNCNKCLPFPSESWDGCIDFNLVPKPLSCYITVCIWHFHWATLQMIWLLKLQLDSLIYSVTERGLYGQLLLCFFLLKVSSCRLFQICVGKPRCSFFMH